MPVIGWQATASCVSVSICPSTGGPGGERGQRTDESIEAMRACWADDPVTYEGTTVSLHDLRVKPKPAHAIPIWVGGTSNAALARAVRLGDGWHGNVGEPHEVAPLLTRLRAERPDEGFTLSTRTGWDGLSSDLDQVRAHLDAFAGAGLQHVLATPGQATLDDWLRSVETLWAVLAPYCDEQTRP